MLIECQQVETCYIGREQYKNALNRTMDLTANPSLGSAGLLVSNSLDKIETSVAIFIDVPAQTGLIDLLLGCMLTVAC